MSLSKDELIKKLETISDLHQKALVIQSKMQDFEPEDRYERKVVVPTFPGEYEDDEAREEVESAVEHTDDDAIEQMGEVYDELHHPKKPIEIQKPSFSEPDTGELRNKESKMGCLSYAAIGIGIFLVLGSIVGVDENTAGTRPVMLILAAIAIAAFFLLKKIVAKTKEEIAAANAQAQAKYDKRIAAIAEEQKSLQQAYESECEAYGVVRQGFLEEYRKWRAVYLDSVAEEEEIEEKLESERVAAVKKIESEEFTPALEALAAANDVLATEYLPAVDILIDLLRSGRADDLKEAINLYEELVYRERQLQLEREREEERRREEALRREDEERRHREEMEARAEQERERRYEESEYRRKEEERHIRENKEREEQEKKAAADAKREAEKRCHWCKNWSKCNLRINPPLTCAAYDPDITHHI